MSKNILNQRGFTLLECMLAIYFSSFIFIAFYHMIALTKKIEYHSLDIQDLNGLLQLKQNLNLASNIEIASDEITYDYRDQNFTISLVNDNLIIHPGTNILMLDIEELQFIEDEEHLSIEYARNERIYRRKIYV